MAVTRQARAKGLAELASAGLIAIERQGVSRYPIVQVLGYDREYVVSIRQVWVA